MGLGPYSLTSCCLIFIFCAGTCEKLSEIVLTCVEGETNGSGRKVNDIHCKLCGEILGLDSESKLIKMEVTLR